MFTIRKNGCSILKIVCCHVLQSLLVANVFSKRWLWLPGAHAKRFPPSSSRFCSQVLEYFTLALATFLIQVKSGRFSWNKTCEFPDAEVVRWFPGFLLNWLFPGIITVVCLVLLVLSLTSWFPGTATLSSSLIQGSNWPVPLYRTHDD